MKDVEGERRREGAPLPASGNVLPGADVIEGVVGANGGECFETDQRPEDFRRVVHRARAIPETAVGVLPAREPADRRTAAWIEPVGRRLFVHAIDPRCRWNGRDVPAVGALLSDGETLASL